jgi:hypothetical protein
MAKIIDAEEVQRELNRAARDASRGPRDVRAGRFVHANARDEASGLNRHRGQTPKGPAPSNTKPAR